MDEKKFIWHCQRMGGTDQAMLSTMEELRHLREFDPKLWGALSCPATGLEFDKRTLELLDTDNDLRIRMPEILDAVDWLCERVNDTADIPNEPKEMALSAINEENEAGKRLKTTAQSILKTLGSEAESISPEQVRQAAETAAEQDFNGDGILPPFAGMDDDVKAFVEAGLSVVGGVKDCSGVAGMNKELGEAFVAEMKNWQAWREEVANSSHPVPNTPEAYSLLQEIKSRVDDFFLRCDLSAFAPQASAPLNAETRLQEAAEKSDITLDDLLNMPLARVEPTAKLPLKNGLNPVWSKQIKNFATLVKPLLANDSQMTQDDWNKIQEAFAPYGDALQKRPGVAAYDAGSFAPPADPAAALDALGDDGVAKLLDPKILQKFHDLCDQDLANAAAGDDIAELEKLVLFYCNIHRLLMNFVSFYDFYTLRPNVTFRAGTLFIDGRSCHLCVPVDDVAKHSAMASISQICLLYCECKRHAADGSVAETRNIMAVLTAGGDDVLIEGRNGVFVDNTGRDWDAKLTKVVHNPISFKQAIWSPYKRISTMVGEAIAKFAANKRAESMAAAEKGIASLTAPKAPGAPFDISKGVGIFAAVGIALGAIGTAIGSIAQALFSLAWWQFPLLIAGIFLIISGPSVCLAWLKFRKRTFGPVLEASGWAVNSQLPISLKLGSALTSIAVVPDNIERQSLLDPFKDEKNPHTGLWVFLGILICAIIFGGWLWASGNMTKIINTFTQTEQVETQKADAPKKVKKDAPKKESAKADKAKSADKGKDTTAKESDEAKAASAETPKDGAAASNAKDAEKDAKAVAKDAAKDAKDVAKDAAKDAKAAAKDAKESSK